jgi:23S rRNA (uracil1939-C5)-methyltransferase
MALPITTQLAITHLNYAGDGCAEYEGKRVYVPFALVGETVEVELVAEKSHFTGKRLQIVKPHAGRQAPPCPHFGADAGEQKKCGGCQLQHMNPALYESWKQERVLQLFAKTGLVHPPPELFITPAHSRRRAVFSVGKDSNAVTLGFNERGSHSLVDIKSCTVLRPRLVALLEPLRELLAGLLNNKDKMDIHATEQDGGVELVFLGKTFTRGEEEKIASWALAHKVGAVFSKTRKEGLRLILNAAPLQASYGGHAVTLPPASFMQASLEAENEMLAFIAPHMKSAHAFLDLFCGAGLFALSFAAGCKSILASDMNDAALDALRLAAKSVPALKIERRNLFKDAFGAAEIKGFDAAILDPPRSGAGTQIGLLAASGIRKIIYVSCNPQSFASEARLLQDAGYAMTALKLFDQFLWSAHIELVAVFEKAKR